MPGKLKSLLRKFNSPKEEALSPRAKELPKTSPNGGRDSDTFPDRRSPPKQVLSEGSNGVKGSGHVNGMESVTHLIGSPRGSSPTVTNFGGPLYAANDTARATNDRGLGPIISSISYNSTCPSDLPRDPRYLCLGGDRRLLTGVSEMRHSEDVASRNIDRYGLSPRHGSLHSDGGLETAKGPLGKQSQYFVTSFLCLEFLNRRTIISKLTNLTSQISAVSAKSQEKRLWETDLLGLQELSPMVRSHPKLRPQDTLLAQD